MKSKRVVTPLTAAVFFVLAVMLLSGCKDLSNDETSEARAIRVEIQSPDQSSQDYLASAFDGRQSNEETLVVGAVVVTTRDTPYTSDLVITDEIEDNLKDELINSINYITFVTLPVTEKYIEFLVPPVTAGKWQVVALTLDFKLENLADVSDYEEKGAIIRKGFEEAFHTSDNIENEIVTITLENY